MVNRSRQRLKLKVVHRHRAGGVEYRRVSELVYVRGKPKAVLGWIDVGGMRTPVYLPELDPSRLHKAKRAPCTFYYDAVTVDPRYEDLATLKG